MARGSPHFRRVSALARVYPREEDREPFAKDPQEAWRDNIPATVAGKLACPALRAAQGQGWVFSVATVQEFTDVRSNSERVSGSSLSSCSEESEDASHRLSLLAVARSLRGALRGTQWTEDPLDHLSSCGRKTAKGLRTSLVVSSLTFWFSHQNVGEAAHGHRRKR